MIDISNPFLVKLSPFTDARGDFLSLIPDSIAIPQIKQINVVKNKLKGTIRGLHFQNFPENESKLLHCVEGSIFDVVVDIRRESRFFLRKYYFTINSNLPTLLFIPQGFAHGYQTLEDETCIIYAHEKSYFPELARRINPFDDCLEIEWPIKMSSISNLDMMSTSIDSSFGGL